jgi:non-ribosomal peptide synthetase component F
LTAYATDWGLPVKSLFLAMCSSGTGFIEGTIAPVVGLIMNGRPELMGADATLGLFVNQLPLRLDLQDASWRGAARLALEAENNLLPYRRFPHSELRQLFGSDPYTVTFNYMRYHPRDELIRSGLVAAGADMRGYASLPVVVDILYEPEDEGLSLEVTADASRFGDRFPEQFLSRMLHNVSRMISDPDSQVFSHEE